MSRRTLQKVTETETRPIGFNAIHSVEFIEFQFDKDLWFELSIKSKDKAKLESFRNSFRLSLDVKLSEEVPHSS